MLEWSIHHPLIDVVATTSTGYVDLHGRYCSRYRKIERLAILADGNVRSL